jgi:hypothetical protein
MALLFDPAGSAPRRIEPADGRSFTLDELQALVGGYIEVVGLAPAGDSDRYVLVVNEDGLSMRLPPNPGATAAVVAANPRVCLLPHGILGPALLCRLTPEGVDTDERMR